MPPQILQLRINSLTPEYSDFVFSDFTDEAIYSIQRAGFSNFEPQVMENGIFLYLTLFLHKFALIEFIITECHQSIEDAKRILNIIVNMMPLEMTELQAGVSVALEITESLVKEKDRFAIINSDEHLLDQYLYLKTGDKISKLGEKYLNKNEENIEHFKIIISDIILGFYAKKDTVPLLQQELGLDPKNAALLGTEVLDLFEIITSDTWNLLVFSEVTSPITSEIHDANLPQLRTMAADMLEERSPVRSTFNPGTTLEEPVYQSTQPEITKPVAPAPSYTAPLYEPPKPNVDVPLEKPRWG